MSQVRYVDYIYVARALPRQLFGAFLHFCSMLLANKSPSITIDIECLQMSRNLPFFNFSIMSLAVSQCLVVFSAVLSVILSVVFYPQCEKNYSASVILSVASCVPCSSVW